METVVLFGYKNDDEDCTLINGILE